MMYEQGLGSRAVAWQRIGGWLLASSALLSSCTHDWDVAEKARAELDGGSDGAIAVEEARADSSLDEEQDASEKPDAGERFDATSPTPDVDAPGLDAIAEYAPDAARDAAFDGQPRDAAPDAVVPARVCASRDAGFCADLEDGLLDVFSWQELTPTTQASLSVVEGGPQPGSRALKCTLTGAAEEAARAALFLTAGEPAWFHAAFDFLPAFDLPAQGGEVFWFKLSEETGMRFPGVGLATDVQGSKLLIHTFDGAQESYEAYPAEALPSGWVHVDVTITFGASGSATLRFNDKLAAVYTGPLHVADVEQSYLQLGLYAQVPSASSALYDNILVSLH